MHLESPGCACDPRPGPHQASIPLISPPGLVCALVSSQVLLTPCPSALSSSPFDTESFLMSPSPTGKFSMGSRKGSLYNWTPPSTPSFRERYYLVSEGGQGCCGHAGVADCGSSPGASMRGWAEQPGASGGSKLWTQPPLFWGQPAWFSVLFLPHCQPSILGASGLGSGLGWFSWMSGIGVLWMVLPLPP